MVASEFVDSLLIARFYQIVSVPQVEIVKVDLSALVQQRRHYYDPIK